MNMMMNDTRMTRDEAPLASMEDISQFNTPLPTPGPSPRSRHRWSQRSSLGIIVDEEETNFDKFDPVPEYEVTDKCDEADDVTDDVDNIADNDNNETLTDTDQLLPAGADIFTTPGPSSVPVIDTKPPLMTPIRRQNGAQFSSTIPRSEVTKAMTRTRTNVSGPRFTSSPSVTIRDTQFLTPRRQRNYRKHGEYHQLEMPTTTSMRHLVRDRFKLVWLNLMFQGFAITLPFNLIIVSNTFYKYLFTSDVVVMTVHPGFLH